MLAVGEFFDLRPICGAGERASLSFEIGGTEIHLSLDGRRVCTSASKKDAANLVQVALFLPVWRSMAGEETPRELFSNKSQMKRR